MKNLQGKRKIALLLVAVMAFCSFTGFTYFNGLGTAYYEAENEIFENVQFGELITAHSVNGIEHAYYVNGNTSNGEIIPIVYNGEVRGTYTLASMIKYAEQQGYKVIAGINGDVFDTGSGVTKGMTMHQGNIVTSGYAPDRVVAFNEQGNASVVPVTLSYTLSGTVGYMKPIIPESIPEGEQENTENVTAPDTDSETDIEQDVKEEFEYVTEDFTRNIDFFNVPFGAANGLHLFNRHYSTSTKTSGQNVEVLIETSDTQLQVNKTIKGIVKSVSPSTSNTVLSDNTLVLSTVAGSASYNTLSSLVIGSEVEISVNDTASGALSDAKECIGIYYSIVENGKNVTAGTNLNPRTALGIKSDGSVMLFEVDGRKASVSKGVNLYDLGNTMISLGCQYAVNLDGGGSSVIYAREPGKDSTATLKSSPSQSSERKVANAILFVYKGSGLNAVENLNLYPNLTLLMPGASAQISAFASNDKYEKVSLNKSVSYSVDSKYGAINSDGLFTASENAEGRARITGNAAGAQGYTDVEITKDINIMPSTTKIITDPGKQSDINITATVGTAGVSIPVKSKDSLFEWSCDSNIGTIDKEGLFTAASETSAQTGNIYVSYGNKKATIAVQVGANIIVFDDTKDYWAKQFIGVLAGLKIIDGMGDNLFAPYDSLTRAQFVAMLAKMTDDFGKTAVNDAGFTDVPEYEWYYTYVNWAATNGIVSGMGEGKFAPDAQITREQMAVMLCNYAASIGLSLPQDTEGVNFTDYASISSWSLDYVMTSVGAGILNGFDTGDFMPQGTAKRGEAAKVIYKLCEIKGMIK
ncbi:MAG: S-layer homology domain-containing protein [Eubacteriales bacterium]|nr:S-layer homology domain-containing protein [Eubacteriales bacterium]